MSSIHLDTGARLISAVLVSLTAVLLLFISSESDLDPYLWQEPFELPSWNEEWDFNDQLVGASALVEGLVRRPASIVLHPESSVDGLYAAADGGLVVYMSSNGSYVRDLFFVGGYLRSCSGNGLDQTGHYHYCKEQTQMGDSSQNEEIEKSCGRPLALRVRKIASHWHLFALDTHHGLFRLNLTSCDKNMYPDSALNKCQVRHLLNANMNVVFSKDASRARLDYSSVVQQQLVTTPPKYFNDFDISDTDNCVYLSDSSYKWSHPHRWKELLDGAPRSRLLRLCNRALLDDSVFAEGVQRHPNGKCRVDRGRLEVVLCGLHYANGVQISRTNDYILVAETTRFRIVKIDMAVVKPVKNIDDNSSANHMRAAFEDIRWTTCMQSSTNNVAFTSIDGFVRAEQDGQFERTGLDVFVDALPGTPDNIRECSINGNILIPLEHKRLIGKFVPYHNWNILLPRYGLLLISKWNGEPIDSHHDSSGRLAGLSEAHYHPESGDLYIGTHLNDFIIVDKLMRRSQRMADELATQTAMVEKYFVENKDIYERWKEQDDKEAVELLRQIPNLF